MIEHCLCSNWAWVQNKQLQEKEMNYEKMIKPDLLYFRTSANSSCTVNVIV